MSTHTDRHFLKVGKEDTFFRGLKKLVREAGIKIPPRCWRIQLMAQPKGTQPAYGEVYLTNEVDLTHDTKGDRSRT